MSLTALDCPEPSAYFAISAAVFILEESCIIGIDPLGVPSQFRFDCGQLLASSGFAIEWPDEDTAEKVRARFRSAPEQVIVVECGPDGPIAYHSIN